jgi:hypothetical protein
MRLPEPSVHPLTRSFLVLLRPPVRRAEGRGYLPAVMARRLARKGGSLLVPGEVGGLAGDADVTG